MNPIPQLSTRIRSPRDWKRKTKSKSASRRRKKFGQISKSKNSFRRHGGGKKKTSFKDILTIILVLFCATVLAGLLASVIFYFVIGRNLPNPDNLSERLVAQSTKIYDRTGETVLYDIHGAQKRTLIKLEDIPEYIKWATVALEDKKFYEHHGFDPVGFSRAVYNNLVHGFGSGGGSTLTQQFVKNAILSSEKKISRKIKELILSFKIENRYSKDEILQMYLNEIPYGSVSYGIEAAAQTFFGKSAKDLELPEAALLASLPQATTYYSPYGSNQDKLLIRTHYTLDQMYEEGYITEEEMNAAKEVDILERIIPRKENILAPHFVMYIKEMLVETYGEKMVEQGGLNVITTLDLDKQFMAEAAIAEQIEINEEEWNGNNAALIALDPKTGQILVMVGSRDYFDEENDGAVNVTTRNRQPGSSFKPIVYAAAFKKGYTPTTMLYDVLTTFKTEIGEDYEPHNYNDKTFGLVTIRQALAGSLNIPAVKTLYLTGISTVLDLADSMGYTTLQDRSRFGLSLVLGGGEVKLLEHASSFGVFATEGEKHEISGILKVEDANGRALEEWEDKEERVLETEVCRQLVGILSDNNARAYVFGESNYLTLGERPVAAKTGTTNDFRDAWTIGFTPSLVAGVWTGNNDNSMMKEGADGSILAAPIWNKFMREALAGTPAETFNSPKSIVTGKASLDGVPPTRRTILVNKETGELATSDTPPELIEERIVQDLHSILHYVNKDDPRGPAPSNPSSEWQYEGWETAIKTWAEGEGVQLLSSSDPEDKDPYREGFVDDESEDGNSIQIEGLDGILIHSPLEGTKLNGREIKVSFTRKKGITLASVEYFVDNQLVARDSSGLNEENPYYRDVNIREDIPYGKHTFTIKFHGDANGEETINFEL
ncbi:MAG: penicillin-binding protein [Parcubacteria group bacterium]|nr:penicillin-binding protein [Parcubacteria group bacterium]